MIQFAVERCRTAGTSEEPAMTNERQEMLEKSATLYFGPWYRQSPFFNATRRAGCTSYDIYNHMYLPAYYDDPEVEYWALNDGVTMWDVGVERTVEVSGPDADRLIDMITCRDLTKCAVKQGKYMLVTGPDGSIVNDPVLLHVAENRWWMQLADSDAGLYALGVAASSGLDAQVSLPDVHPMQVQGPASAKTLEKLVGSAIYDLKYYWIEEFEIRGIPVVISRTGWTAIPGFEVNLLDGSKGDELWDAVAEAGTEFDIRPIAPCEGRRIEGGIFNYGSDIRLGDTPFHVMGLERLVEEQPQDYIGKAALEALRANGVDRKLVGIELEGDELRAEMSEYWYVSSGGKQVGHMTDAVWSPGLKKNIGYVWVPIALAEPGNRLDVETEGGEHLVGVTSAIPFVDPRKERPAATLR
jgi:glycine cleavage system aminomethyltransferase T